MNWNIVRAWLGTLTRVRSNISPVLKQKQKKLQVSGGTSHEQDPEARHILQTVCKIKTGGQPQILESTPNKNVAQSSVEFYLPCRPTKVNSLLFAVVPLAVGACRSGVPCPLLGQSRRQQGSSSWPPYGPQ